MKQTTHKKASSSKQEDKEYDVDVAIVGGGGAGMAAAASASADGAKVLVLEKTGAIGGNTKLGEGTYNSVILLDRRTLK